MTNEIAHFDAASLVGTLIPHTDLISTDGVPVNLRDVQNRFLVIYAYPRTSAPGVAPLKDWDVIPGAKGCTPQSCSFRDHHDDLSSLGAAVFGVSTQDTDYQREAVGRLHLPFPLLSDSGLTFAKSLGLPTFEVEGLVLLRRLTLISENGYIRRVMYPITKPEENASDVISILRNWNK
ncbi:peroxiredoxin [Agrobacterium tumefaciens]|uniref:Peroxiredoxin n=1 Tax=Agrobacterium tumefaciens TaxID=358 RepID=A0AA44F0M2_AGRTU|nr:peroxiredoxin [Agrobacterium tumefaciens]NSL23070.1 peroxiredoxin [Agrobacterium tumefaciens]NTB89657.1 peroxiredoxin [Agrobacterium tumefaciens]NTC15487.1 peroxiredoxin [Agrobacterium tumefaciens]NTC26571.1 peroxiredoxin [Agrobacterium tumefaciens]NTC58147.1 peroxiredoxin [Agrobacterium tumefaciens]